MPLTLNVLPFDLTLYRLPATALYPAGLPWDSPFISVTRTAEEWSIILPTSICPELTVRGPESFKMEAGWRGLQVMGPLDFSLTGILAGLVQPLADASISIFALSTFDTDYLLIKAVDFGAATEVLVKAGYVICDAVTG